MPSTLFVTWTYYTWKPHRFSYNIHTALHSIYIPYTTSIYDYVSRHSLHIHPSIHLSPSKHTKRNTLHTERFVLYDCHPQQWTKIYTTHKKHCVFTNWAKYNIFFLVISPAFITTLLPCGDKKSIIVIISFFKALSIILVFFVRAVLWHILYIILACLCYIICVYVLLALALILFFMR